MLRRVVALAGAAHALQLQQIAHFEKVAIKSPEAYAPRQEVTVVDLMPHLHRLVKDSKLQQGCVNVVSMHTTTAITKEKKSVHLAHTPSVGSVCSTIASSFRFVCVGQQDRWPA